MKRWFKRYFHVAIATSFGPGRLLANMVKEPLDCGIPKAERLACQGIVTNYIYQARLTFYIWIDHLG